MCDVRVCLSAYIPIYDEVTRNRPPRSIGSSPGGLLQLYNLWRRDRIVLIIRAHGTLSGVIICVCAEQNKRNSRKDREQLRERERERVTASLGNITIVVVVVATHFEVTQARVKQSCHFRSSTRETNSVHTASLDSELRYGTVSACVDVARSS